MRTHVKALLAALVLVPALVLGACSKHTSEDAQGTKPTTTTQPGLAPAQVAPGAPIADPARKTVVVVAAPSAPALVAARQQRLVVENEKSTTRLHSLMQSYAANLDDAASKVKYQKQMARELDAYKRRSLELFEMQRQQDVALHAGASDTSQGQ